MMKFPYGIADFKTIISEGYYYCDRTGKIPLLESAKSQLFIRPRRFGKSLVLSMLENYYDVAKKEAFDSLFGHLAIGAKPTALRNTYFILRWDFSCVMTVGTMEEVRQALFDHINSCIEGFLLYYRNFSLPRVKINEHNAIASINNLLNAVKTTSWPIYLLIDEYDNFANTILMGVHKDKSRYDALVHDEGILRTLFKAIKSATGSGGFDRVFITGVSPVVLSDITSGYNIAKNTYFHPELNDLCGFSEAEVRQVLEKIAETCEFDPAKSGEALAMMKDFYNGYRFAPGLETNIYNPTLCLYFFDHFQEMCAYPRKMLDTNLATDESKLEYISQIPLGRDLLMDLVQKDHVIAVPGISDRFGIREMLSAGSRDHTFLASFLYYFGVLTLAGETDDLKILLRVPNLVMHSLYVERVQKMLLPEPRIRDEGRWAAELVFQKGDIQPLCAFVETTLFSVFKNRDYRWANELTVKTAFLTLLYNDYLYIMDSEPETGRQYADLTMIIRPDKRHGKIFDVLIEFKYVSLKQAGLTAEAARNLSGDQVAVLVPVKAALDQGEQQAATYAGHLAKKYPDLRLKTFVVAALGFERLSFKAVS